MCNIASSEPGFITRMTNHLEVHNIFGMQNSRGTFEGLLKLQPNVRPIRNDPRELRGGAPLCRYVVGRQLEHMGPSAADDAATGEPGSERIRDVRR